jgi:hypothetical protein
MDETGFTANGKNEWRYATPASSRCARAVLAFDIETTGLDPERCMVTCICAYDPERGIERSFVFDVGDSEPEEEFLAMMDDAPLLCAFNGVRFDLPFLARRWGIPDERVGGWVRKMVDPFEACKLALNRTFSLNKLLVANGLPVKTGSGLEAVRMAHEKRWGELAEYCMHDTKMTHAAVTRAGGAILPPGTVSATPAGAILPPGTVSATPAGDNSSKGRRWPPRKK